MRGLAGLGVVSISAAMLVAAVAAGPRAGISTTTPSQSASVVDGPGIGEYVGAGSCANRGCHGGIDPVEDPAILRVLGNEYTNWLLRDPHVGAYDVLKSERSRRIASDLGKSALGGIFPAHEDSRCLACHQTPTSGVSGIEARGHADRVSVSSPKPTTAEASAIGGVSCESCHGPAAGWLEAHTSTEWASKEPEEKAKFGMLPVSGLAARIRNCAGCHVGAPAGGTVAELRDVNHDLIAAGHPRMAFEASWFHDALPKHWRPEPDALPEYWRPEQDDSSSPKGRALLWAIGQAETAAAALDLLADRASGDEGRPWPELAEYDCFGCHHDLVPEGWRLDEYHGETTPGRPSWSTWATALLPELSGATPGVEPPQLDGLADLRRRMQAKAGSNREDIAASAKTLADELRRWSSDLEKLGEGKKAAASRAWLSAVMEPVGGDSPPSWARDVQRFLALDVLRRALPGDAEAARAEAELEALRSNLDFEPTYQSPRGYVPAGAESVEESESP